MAAICLDSQSLSVFVVEQTEVFEAFPKIENHVGDIPYAPEVSRLLLLHSKTAHPDSCIGLKAFSITLVLMFGVIVWLLGGKVMYYIPLYLALAPVVYWLLKIGFAFYVVKSHKLHVGSHAFSGKNHG